MQPHHPIIYTADMGSLFVMLGTFWGALPNWVALLAGIWYLISIYKLLMK